MNHRGTVDHMAENGEDTGPDGPENRVTTLITDALRATGTSRDALAKTLGLSRTTLWRKLAKLDPATLRRVAQAAGLEYPALLRAAMLDAELIGSPAELLDGMTIVPVIRVVSDGPARAEVAAVFADPDRARGYAELANELDTDSDADYQTDAIDIDTAAELDHVTVYTAHWTCRTDTIAVSARRYQQLPNALDNTDGISPDVWASAADHIDNPATVDNITALSVDATSESAARSALAATVDQLRATGRLAQLGSQSSSGGKRSWSSNPVQRVPASFAGVRQAPADQVDLEPPNLIADAVRFAAERYRGPRTTVALPRTTPTAPGKAPQ